ncbi:MAG: hypothetical protein NZT92_12535, partial [Abditibacteriales bacterium]|nr:hypothetical protein [Abditibacteriales bacterium]MDW8366525.1 hypothetical protein [Abditibacteriales bacterium]
MADLKPGDRVSISSFPEPAEVFSFERTASQVRLGIILLQSKRAERLVLSLEEFEQRVKRLPSLWDDLDTYALP